MFERILVPLDGSRRAEQAQPIAARKGVPGLRRAASTAQVEQKEAIAVCYNHSISLYDI